MAIDFPASPADGATFTNGNARYTYSSATGAWKASPLGTAMPFNHLINPNFLASQQNGSVAGSTSAYFMADQMQMQVASGGTGAASGSRMVSTTPRGSTYRCWITITTTQAATAAGTFLAFTQNLEGNRVFPFHFQYSTFYSKPMVVRFGFKGPAGTYCATLRNGAHLRTCSKEFTITAGQANTDTEQVITFAPDQAGTWTTDTSLSMELWITLAAGSTYNTNTAGVWAGSSAAIATANQYNGFAAMNNFELFDVGMYIDPNGTGRAPPWEAPTELESVMEAQRYWYKMMTGSGHASATTTAAKIGAKHPVVMRTAAGTFTVVGTPTGHDGTVNNVLSAPVSSMSIWHSDFNFTATGLTQYRAVQLIGTTSSYIAINVRP